jgi:hypothetical protein
MGDLKLNKRCKIWHQATSASHSLSRDWAGLGRLETE